ncbi:MAG: hypothetical protein JNM57_07175 [Cyclobacteriaceae bacterium]|nr:hypothetical protein [Cyclobacteriaceae bacterium]
MKNWFYIFVGVLFVSMLFISSRYFKGSGNSSVGLTKAKEFKISSEKSSQIKKVYVVPGRQVKAGEMLVELTSNQLEMDIDKLTNKIAVLKSEQMEKSKLTESKIAFVRAEYGISIEKLDTEIEQIKSESSLNQKLAKEFGSTDAVSSAADENPMQVKMKSLEQQKAKQRQAMEIKIQDILQESKTDQSLLINQIRLQERELEFLDEERKKLSKFASSDGVVENVFVKEGEQVNAFTALLSVHPLRPTMVVGYMVGRKLSMPAIGASVTVSSYDHRSVWITGNVIGYGSVTELPEILQKSTAVKAFGREIFIEIPPQNDFATGEKVLIR